MLDDIQIRIGLSSFGAILILGLLATIL